jgi:hypothetical protein
MSFYRWAMRNGSVILFVTALLLFLVSFLGQFLLGWSTTLHASLPDEPGHAPDRLVFVVSAVASALSQSALIFAGACIVHFLERRTGSKGPSQ